MNVRMVNERFTEAPTTVTSQSTVRGPEHEAKDSSGSRLVVNLLRIHACRIIDMYKNKSLSRRTPGLQDRHGVRWEWFRNVQMGICRGTNLRYMMIRYLIS